MTLGQRLRTTTALHAVAALALIAAPLPAAAQLAPNARPTGGQVTAGQASIGQSTTTTTVSQASQRAAVNWQSFDVGSQQTVDFKQPSSSAVTLNRVVGPNPSEIAGHIQANGQLVVVNQAGVVFDKGSQVNAAGLVVSAAGISDGNFMAGKMAFDQAANPNARIENHGTITVKDHGLAVLVAPQVRNSGTIQAKLGTVVLAGAEAETLDLYGDGLVTINVTKQVRSAPDGTKALVTNTGTIAAKGGSVVLTADAVDGVVQTLVDAGGHISADSSAARTGRVLISGSGGDVRVEGVVTAQGNAPGLAGGTVQVSGSNATIVGAHARISAAGQAGGGTIALGTTLARAQGGGTGTAAATTKTLVVRKGATVSADATGKGSGGRVVLLSADSTTMAGTITAKGGTQGGDGGFVEVSGGVLTLTGHVDASAPVGNTGTLLLDPSDLWVSDTKPAVATYTVTSGDLPTVGANAAPNLATVSWVSPKLLQSENANISLAATDQLYVASSYMGGNTVNLGSHTFSLTGGTGLTVDRGFTIDAGRINLTTLTGVITLDGASGVSSGLITAPQLAMLSDTGLAAPVVVVAGAGGIALGSAMLGTAGTPLGILDLSSSGGSVAQDAGGSVFAGTLQSTGGVAHGIDLAGTGNDIARLGTITAGTGFVLNDAATTLSVDGAVDGGTSLSVTNTGNLAIGAGISATGIVSLTADGIAQYGGVITAGLLTGSAGAGAAHLGLASTNDVAELGAFTAGQGFGLRDGVATLKVVGAVDGGIGVYLVNTGSLVIAAGLSGTGTVSLIGDGITQYGGVINAGTLTGDAGAGAAHLGLASTNHVARLGPFSAAQGFGLRNDTPTLTVAGAVDGGIGVWLVNSGNIAIDAGLTSTSVVSLIGNGIAQSGAGVINAGTLFGSAGAGAAALGTAANKVTELGPFTATTGFTLNDKVGTLAVIGAVDGGTRVALTNSGSLAIDATIGATGTVALKAVGITQNASGIITAGTLTGSAGSGFARLDGADNKVAYLGPFTTGAGFALNDDNASLTVGGAVAGGASLGIVNTGSLIIDAAVGATGSARLVANGITQSGAGIITASTLTGSAGSGAAALGAATNRVTALGPFSATTGFTLNDGVVKLTVADAVDGGTAVALTNTGSLAIDAAISGTGTVALMAAGIGQSINGIVTAGTLTGSAGADAARFDGAANKVSNLGPFTAGAGFALNDHTAGLIIGGAINGGPSVSLTNTGSLAIDAAIGAAGTVTLNANGIAQNGAGIITAGTLTGSAGSGAAELGVATNLVGTLGPFSAATGFDLNDGVAGLTVAGAVNGGSSVRLANTGSLVLHAPVSATGLVTLDANGIVQNAAGAITAARLAGNAGAGAAQLGLAANAVADLGAFIATDGFTLNDSVSVLTVADTVNGGSLVALANTGTLTGDAGGGVFYLGAAPNVVTRLGPITAGTGFTLTDATPSLTVAGAVNGGTFVTLTNTGSLAIQAAIDASNTVTLDANGIGQSAAGAITAGTLTGTAGSGAAQLDGAMNAVSNLGPFTAAAGFALNNDTPALNVVGAIDGGPSVTLANTGSLALDAAIGGTSTVALNANGITQTAAGIITTSTLSGTAGSGSADLGTATNLVTNLGPFTAATGFTLNDNIGTLTVAGAVNGGTDVSLTNTGSLALDAAIRGTSTVALNANGITQTAAGITHQSVS
jgi:filamentous hemagglutinin family protein